MDTSLPERGGEGGHVPFFSLVDPPMSIKLQWGLEDMTDGGIHIFYETKFLYEGVFMLFSYVFIENENSAIAWQSLGGFI